MVVMVWLVIVMKIMATVTIMMVMIIIVIIIIITFKGAIRDFFTISSQRRNVSNTYAQVAQCANTCNTSIAYHVQVSCYVPRGTKGQLSS